MFRIDDERLPSRFWSKVVPEPNSGCWLWSGALNSGGYGCFNFGGSKGRGAHRVAYQVLVGEIPAGLHLDHLCRTRCCVNPAHLEPVTQRENCLRGVSPAAIHAKKTHCPKGHLFEGENLARWGDGSQRFCRACDNLRSEIARRAAGMRDRSSITHCPRGHPYEGRNLMLESIGGGQKARRCRTCRNVYGALKKRRAARKSAA